MGGKERDARLFYQSFIPDILLFSIGKGTCLPFAVQAGMPISKRVIEKLKLITPNN